MGTSGPGATNLVTGIGTPSSTPSRWSRSPATCPSRLIGKDAVPGDRHQRHHPADDEAQLPRPGRERPAARPRRGLPHRPDRRPGPVHVDITKDALQQETTAPHPTHDEVVAGLPGFRPNLDANGRQLKIAAAEIAKAKRPVILAGHGILHAEAWDELVALAEKAQIPVAHTLLGIGAIDETHPLSYGYMGMHGWKHVNKAIQSADLLVAIGMRFDDR
jgi:acetolactate synthase-1/2/3 large subunit